MDRAELALYEEGAGGPCILEKCGHRVSSKGSNSMYTIQDSIRLLPNKSSWSIGSSYSGVVSSLLPVQ